MRTLDPLGFNKATRRFQRNGVRPVGDFWDNLGSTVENVAPGIVNKLLGTETPATPAQPPVYSTSTGVRYVTNAQGQAVPIAGASGSGVAGTSLPLVLGIGALALVFLLKK